VAEVGVGVVGEPHGDEAKLVAWSAGPDGGRWSLSAWRRPGRRKKPGGMPRRSSRLGDWARGCVEEEDGREAADYPAGGALVRLVDDIAWRGAARSLDEQGQAER
jgi:hypothetical protein